MDYTVGDLLKMSVFRKAEYIGRKEELGNAITGITVVDSPDISSWIKGGEIILTSFFPIRGMSADEMRQWMNELADQKISVLIVKIRSAFKEIPKSIMEVCEERAIPIINIPHDVAFTDVTYPVMGQLINNQVEALKYFKEIHNRFTELSLRNVDRVTVIETLKELIGNPVTLYNEFFQKIATTDQGVELFYDMDQQMEEERDYDTRFPIYKRRVFFPMLQDMQAKQIIVPIKSIKQTEMNLVISTVNREVSDHDYIAIENAATALSLDMVKQIAISEVEKKFKNDLIDDLLQGKIKTMDTVYHRAGISHIDLEGKYAVVIFSLHPRDKQERYDHQEIQKDYEVLIDNIQFYLNDAIIRERADEVIVLWKVNQKLGNEKQRITQIKKTIEHIKGKFHEIIPGYYAQVGIGNVSPSIMELAQSYKEAQDTLYIGQTYQKNKEFTLTFNDLGIYRLLYQFDDVGELKKFIPASLLKLLDYGKANKADLLDTLAVYLQHQQNITKAAEELFVHYKTVTYRLDRIKEITGMNFGDADEMLSVQVGLRIVDVIRRQEEAKNEW